MEFHLTIWPCQTSFAQPMPPTIESRPPMSAARFWTENFQFGGLSRTSSTRTWIKIMFNVISILCQSYLLFQPMYQYSSISLQVLNKYKLNCINCFYIKWTGFVRIHKILILCCAHVYLVTSYFYRSHETGECSSLSGDMCFSIIVLFTSIPIGAKRMNLGYVAAVPTSRQTQGNKLWGMNLAWS